MGWLETLQTLEYYSRFPVPSGFQYGITVSFAGMSQQVTLMFVRDDDDETLIVDIEAVPNACAMGNLVGHFNDHFGIGDPARQPAE